MNGEKESNIFIGGNFFCFSSTRYGRFIATGAQKVDIVAHSMESLTKVFF